MHEARAHDTVSATRWHYRAADASGREQEGSLLARDAAAATAQLRAQSLWVVELTPDVAQTPAADQRLTQVFAPVRAWWRRTTGAEAESLAVALRALSALLAAGVPLDRALGFVVDTDDWRETFARLRARVEAGVSLSAAMRDTPQLPVALAPAVAAAEESGALAAVLERTATHLERQARVLATVRASLTYPALLAVAATVGTSVILLVVVPRFAMLLADAGVALPWSTRALLAMGTLIGRFGWLVPAMVAVVAWQWRFARRNEATLLRWHTRRLAWPIVGSLERARAGAGYLGTLALALDAGLPVLRAMALARDTMSNRALSALCAQAEASVRDGRPLAAALAPVLPALARRLLEAGEASGTLSAMAVRAADAADDVVTRRIARAVTLVEPLLILGFGGVVGFVALALLQAIYGLNAGTF